MILGQLAVRHSARVVPAVGEDHQVCVALLDLPRDVLLVPVGQALGKGAEHAELVPDDAGLGLHHHAVGAGLAATPRANTDGVWPGLDVDDVVAIFEGVGAAGENGGLVAIDFELELSGAFVGGVPQLDVGGLVAGFFVAGGDLGLATTGRQERHPA